MKYTFVKKPVVHLIAETSSVPVDTSFVKHMKQRGSDVDNVLDVFHDTLPWECLEKEGGGLVTETELLPVFAGKNCYNAFGSKGSKKSTKQYLDDTIYKSEHPHLSIAYHTHFTFYISGISRRIGEELKRHVIGTAVSQLSSRYCIHLPRFVVPPAYLTENHPKYVDFKSDCKDAYNNYHWYAEEASALKGMEKKRVLEAAAGLLPMCTETTIIFSMNPISARKMILERTAENADLEFKRLAEKIRDVLEKRYSAFSFR